MGIIYIFKYKKEVEDLNAIKNMIVNTRKSMNRFGGIL